MQPVRDGRPKILGISVSRLPSAPASTLGRRAKCFPDLRAKCSLYVCSDATRLRYRGVITGLNPMAVTLKGSRPQTGYQATCYFGTDRGEGSPAVVSARCWPVRASRWHWTQSWSSGRQCHARGGVVSHTSLRGMRWRWTENGSKNSGLRLAPGHAGWPTRLHRCHLTNMETSAPTSPARLPVLLLDASAFTNSPAGRL